VKLPRRRRRAIVMLALAAGCGVVAASDVDRRARRAEAQVGPTVPVAVSRAPLRAGTHLTGSVLASSFTIRQAPSRFVPPDSLPTAAEAAGATLAVPLAAGSYLTGAVLARRAITGPGGSAARGGERLVELNVAAGPDVLAAGPGVRVDVLLTTGGDGGHGKTYLALEDVQVGAIRSGGGDGGGHGGSDGAAARANAVASLQVNLRQAVFLTAAESFAREVRLLLRPPGDEQRAGQAVAVTDSAL